MLLFHCGLYVYLNYLFDLKTFKTSIHFFFYFPFWWNSDIYFLHDEHTVSFFMSFIDIEVYFLYTAEGWVLFFVSILLVCIFLLGPLMMRATNEQWPLITVILLLLFMVVVVVVGCVFFCLYVSIILVLLKWDYYFLCFHVCSSFPWIRIFQKCNVLFIKSVSNIFGKNHNTKTYFYFVLLMNLWKS